MTRGQGDHRPSVTPPQILQQLSAADVLLELQLERIVGGEQDVEAGDVAQRERQMLDEVMGDVELVELLEMIDVARNLGDLVVGQI